MAAPRFELYMKADSKGSGIGDCPFSLKALMFIKLKTTPESKVFKITPVDLVNKPAEFVKLTPSGSTPVLVDHQNDKVITDSGEITAYLDSVFPKVDLKLSNDGPAVAATNGIFPKLIGLLKKSDQASAAMTAELQKVNNYLTSPEHKGKYLLGDNLSALDCDLIPKLKMVQVAGGHYRNYEIPAELTGVIEYMKQAFSSPCFAEICPDDSEFVHGWKRHGMTPDPK